MRYIPEWNSVKQHTVPAWYEDGKIGIFIHWGPYSVPAWAPPTVELGAIEADEGWFCNNPYSEWYWNSVRVGRGPTYEHHIKTYGKDFPYENFTHMWKAERWSPREWAELFRQAGARYVIPVTKHHDGFCLWDSDYTDYTSCHRGPHRDIIEELARSVRSEGMRLGLYYSGIIDWRFASRPMYTDYDVHHPDCISYEYSDYAYRQTMELIEKYRPSVLWNDIGWPYKGEADLPYLFSHYYNTVEEGVVNDRFNGLWCDFTTREYQLGDKTLDKKWECCRGLGLSFAYNQEEGEEHLIGHNDLITLLADTVAHNGNLLINVGPKADGTIPENQADRLLYMGRWLAANGEAIYGTRPCARPMQECPGGETLYFTQNETSLFLLIDRPKAGSSRVTARGLGTEPRHGLSLSGADIRLERTGEDLVLHLQNIPENSPALAVQLSRAGN